MDDRPAFLGSEDFGMGTDSSDGSGGFGPIEYNDSFQYAGIEVGIR